MTKYFWPIKSLPFYCILLCSLPVSFILAHYSYSDKCSCQIQIVLNSPKPVNFAIYYDTGKGWNQNDFQEKAIDTINQETTVTFCIPRYDHLKGIRIDPATEQIKMEIFSINLTYADGRSYTVPLDTLQVGPQILSSEWNGTSLIFESIPNGTDPNFLLSKLSEQDAQKETNKMILYYGIWLMGGMAGVLLGRFIFLFFFMGV